LKFHALNFLSFFFTFALVAGQADQGLSGADLPG
jgi:hypothetical protein